MSDLPTPENQQPIALVFSTELAALGEEYKEKGLHDLTRAGVLMGGTLAILDLQFHQESGRTLNEQEFVEIARRMYREIRKTKGQAS